MNNKSNPNVGDASEVEMNKNIVGSKRALSLATATENAQARKGAAKLVPTRGGNASLIRETISTAVLQVIPADPQVYLVRWELLDRLALRKLWIRLALLDQPRAAIDLLQASIANGRIRRLNRRLRPNQQWIPLQREVPQVEGGVPVGALPQEGLIPVRGLQVTLTPDNLHLLGHHYGVNFASWEEFLDYLQW
eukprot:gene30714-37112_t